ncbi:MAG: UbiA family prenyltransferase [Planctomycetaceae bacterium]|nr:UbiA family prenyltransferase [Planctomycetaceae bacterium]
MKLRTFLQLIRIQNLPTAVADALAGFFIANAGQEFEVEHGRALAVAALASACLYSGGMANNDAQHAHKDQMLGKPRPIVRGEVSLGEAHWNSVVLMIAGILAAYSAAGKPGFLIGGIIAIFCLTYNRLARGSVGSDGYIRPSVIANASGAVLLAFCRALNVWLGMVAAIAVRNEFQNNFASLMGNVDPAAWVALGVVFLYFLTVIGVSLLEDFGGGTSGLKALAVSSGLVVIAAPLAVDYAGGGENFITPEASHVVALALSLALLMLLMKRFRNAIRDPRPPVIGQVVRWGIIGEPLLLGAMVLMATGSLVQGLGIAVLTLTCLALARLSHST